MGVFSDLLGTLRSTFKVGKATLDASGVSASRSITVQDVAGTLAVVRSAAIAEGDNTPNPGTTGIKIWSTTLGREMVWNGSNWKACVNVTVGTTSPPNPVTGDIWVDTN